MRPIGTSAELEARRRRAVQAFHQGERVADIARIFGVVRPSVYRWLKLDQQADGLAARAHPGPAPRLSVDQERELETLLLQGADAHGWRNRLWTTARVAELIRRHFGFTMHHDHVGRMLRKRLRWSPQKPRRRARERNEAAIDVWRKDTFPRLAEETRQRGGYLVFLDESGFMLTPTVRRTWAPRGSKPLLECWDRRDRISAISAITFSPKRGRANLHFRLLPPDTNARATDIVAFLRQLKSEVRAPLTVVWDGSNLHSRSRLVKAYLAKHPEIVAETLPAYAPELNPDELVWGWSKYGSLANLAAEDTDELTEEIIDDFVYLKENPHLLHAFIGKTGLLAA